MGVETAVLEADRQNSQQTQLPAPLKATIELHARRYNEGTLSERGAANFFIYYKFLPYQCPDNLRLVLFTLYEDLKQPSKKSTSQLQKIALA